MKTKIYMLKVSNFSGLPSLVPGVRNIIKSNIVYAPEISNKSAVFIGVPFCFSLK